jgi:hypothetical protein
MIHYFTNRELSQKLDINLARWKRWSRSFLPPDPLGGMQSGYPRQYLFKDLFKVFVGGHLLSLLKLPVADCRQVLEDISPWLKKNGYFDWDGINGVRRGENLLEQPCWIYFGPLQSNDHRSGRRFRYLVRKTIHVQSDDSPGGRVVQATYVETSIHGEPFCGSDLLRDPAVRLINLNALLATVIHKLYPNHQ